MVQIMFGSRVGESPTPLSFEGFVDGVSVGMTPRAIEVSPGLHTFQIKATPYNVITGGYRLKDWEDQNGNVMGTADIQQIPIPEEVASNASIIAVYDWLPGNPWIIPVGIALVSIPIIVYLWKRK